jgi:anti-anti-sigma factor
MADATLDIKVEEKEQVKIVTLTGPVDSATHDQFKTTLDPIFMAPSANVVIDCLGLTYINSKGLSLLARYHRNCYASQGKMAVCNVNQKLIRTMDLLGLGKILKFYENRNAALASMR